jgi:hypothetical protein
VEIPSDYLVWNTSTFKVPLDRLSSAPLRFDSKTVTTFAADTYALSVAPAKSRLNDAKAKSPSAAPETATVVLTDAPFATVAGSQVAVAAEPAGPTVEKEDREIWCPFRTPPLA